MMINVRKLIRNKAAVVIMARESMSF